MAAEHPILFTPEHVVKIREGRKTQTRRAVKEDCVRLPKGDGAPFLSECPFGQPGDRLWVKEALCDFHGMARYKLDEKSVERNEDLAPWYWKGREALSAMYMPRWAARLFLEITDIRTELVQDISEADALAEGIEKKREVNEGLAKMVLGPHVDIFYPGGFPTAVRAYGWLWDQINKKREAGAFAWDMNPWVWCISFKVVK